MKAFSHCRALDCGVSIPAEHLMCARHGREVPLEVAMRVKESTGVPWVHAMAEALTRVATAEGKDPLRHPLVAFSHRLKQREREEAAA